MRELREKLSGYPDDTEVLVEVAKQVNHFKVVLIKTNDNGSAVSVEELDKVNDSN